MTILLKPFELLWRGLNRLRRALYRRGVLKAKRLPKPVISVGAITAGGAGKTPATIAIGEYLIARGYRVAVLTRGYKRSGAGGLVHEPDAAGTEPQRSTKSAQPLKMDVTRRDSVRVNAGNRPLDVGTRRGREDHVFVRRRRRIRIEGLPVPGHGQAGPRRGDVRGRLDRW